MGWFSDGEFLGGLMVPPPRRELSETERAAHAAAHAAEVDRRADPAYWIGLVENTLNEDAHDARDLPKPGAVEELLAWFERRGGLAWLGQWLNATGLVSVDPADMVRARAVLEMAQSYYITEVLL